MRRIYGKDKTFAEGDHPLASQASRNYHSRRGGFGVGIYELASRIGELKALGHKITSTKGTSVNRFGTVHFNIYKLEA